MASLGLTTPLGGLELRSPLIAASGTVGAVWEWAQVADTQPFGAAVAKSVAPEPWTGRPAPRMAPLPTGMLNGIGIQNPGIEAWVAEVAPHLGEVGVPVWGSAVAGDASGFARVADKLVAAGVAAVEVNLSCPNLDDGEMFSFDPNRTGDVIGAVAEVVTVPVGAKLSPNTPELLAVSEAAIDAGADFLVLTNTAFGFGIEIESRETLLSGGIGGYSGPGLKPISLRCVYEVAKAMPDVPIVGCGGVTSGRDVVEYLMSGAHAVAAGTSLLADPDAGARIVAELESLLEDLGAKSVSELVGSAVGL